MRLCAGSPLWQIAAHRCVEVETVVVVEQHQGRRRADDLRERSEVIHRACWIHRGASRAPVQVTESVLEERRVTAADEHRPPGISARLQPVRRDTADDRQGVLRRCCGCRGFRRYRAAGRGAAQSSATITCIPERRSRVARASQCGARLRRRCRGVAEGVTEGVAEGVAAGAAGVAGGTAGASAGAAAGRLAGPVRLRGGASCRVARLRHRPRVQPGAACEQDQPHLGRRRHDCESTPSLSSDTKNVIAPERLGSGGRGPRGGSPKRRARAGGLFDLRAVGRVHGERARSAGDERLRIADKVVHSSRVERERDRACFRTRGPDVDLFLRSRFDDHHAIAHDEIGDRLYLRCGGAQRRRRTGGSIGAENPASLQPACEAHQPGWLAISYRAGERAGCCCVRRSAGVPYPQTRSTA